MISKKIDLVIREVPDFPKRGINFKDITTLLLDQELSSEIIDTFINRLKGKKVDAIVGVVKVLFVNVSVVALPTRVSVAEGKVKVTSAVDAGPIRVTALVPLSLSS